MAFKPYQGKRKGRSRFRENPWEGTLRNVLGDLVSQGVSFGFDQLGKAIDRPREDAMLSAQRQEAKMKEELASREKEADKAWDIAKEEARAKDRELRHNERMAALQARGGQKESELGIPQERLGGLLKQLRRGGRESQKLATETALDPMGVGEQDVVGTSKMRVTMDPQSVTGPRSARLVDPDPRSRPDDSTKPIILADDEKKIKAGRAASPQEAQQRISKRIAGLPRGELDRMGQSAYEKGFPQRQELSRESHAAVGSRQRERHRFQREESRKHTERQAGLLALKQSLGDVFGLGDPERSGKLVDEFVGKYAGGPDEAVSDLQKLVDAKMSKEQILEFMKRNM